MHPIKSQSCLRVDLHKGALIVGCSVSYGHEILAGIFGRISLADIGHSGSGSITSFGQANIPLSEGTKSPDYSLYEVGTGKAEFIPTVAWEVGYSESEKKLALDAARLL